MKEKDPDWLFQLEKAIEKKYGKETIKSFKEKISDKEKERIIIESKELRKKEEKKKNTSIEINGIYVPKKLIKIENYNCIKCNKLILNKEDNFFYKKYKTCKTCFILFVENRENTWLKKIGEFTNG